MDPFTVMKWLGACAEPPIEEAQPAWWLELQHAEALHEEEMRSRDSQGEYAALSDPNFGKRFNKNIDIQRTGVATEHRCYENDAELVVLEAPCKPTRGQPPRYPESEQMPPWDLTDLDDFDGSHRMVAPATETPPPSLAGNFSASSFVDFQCGDRPIDAEPVFHISPQVSIDLERSRSLPG